MCRYEVTVHTTLDHDSDNDKDGMMVLYCVTLCRYMTLLCTHNIRTVRRRCLEIGINRGM